MFLCWPIKTHETGGSEQWWLTLLWRNSLTCLRKKNEKEMIMLCVFLHVNISYQNKGPLWFSSLGSHGADFSVWFFLPLLFLSVSLRLSYLHNMSGSSFISHLFGLMSPALKNEYFSILSSIAVVSSCDFTCLGRKECTSFVRLNKR